MQGKKTKVLLVDDAKIALMMEKTMLANAGYDLVIARDGVEAVEKAVAESPDLILMDVMMPRMGGFDAVRALRAKKETRNIPIIMVTSKSDEDKVVEGYSAGCNDYVTKPIDPVVLGEKIKNLIGG